MQLESVARTVEEPCYYGNEMGADRIVTLVHSLTRFDKLPCHTLRDRYYI